MKRGLAIFLVGAVVLMALAGGVYALRRGSFRSLMSASLMKMRAAIDPPREMTPAEKSDRADMPGGTDPTDPASTPRGDITVEPRRQQMIGVRTVPVTRESLDQTVRAAGVVRYDETKQADVNVKVEGWIRELYVDSTGQPVQKGQPLFALYSPDLLNTQHEYLLALNTRDQLQQSTIPDALRRADDVVASARQRLTLWDLPADDLRVLEETRKATDAVVFRSPASGFVIEKAALAGLHVMPGQSLYKVADLSTVWVEADVYEKEIAGVKVGALATVSIDAYPGEPFTGRVVYVYPYLDEKTRTNTVRFELPNRTGRLKPGMYANVEMTVGGGVGLTVPTNAVLDSGKEQVVFVAHGDGVFEPRKVTIGRRLGETTQILSGVNEGDQVATGATFFLDSESQLRASLQRYDTSDAPSGPAPTSNLDINVRTTPEPLKVGDIQLEATVKDMNGAPVEGADVSVQFVMPAMPSMNMPAMRSEMKLSPAGSGVYRGIGQVLMVGRWDTTVTVVRGGQLLGSRQLAMVAR